MSPVDTRTLILETARRLFHEQGYAATGIATILREAGVNAGSLYHFFSGKEALLAAVLEHYEGLLEPYVMGPAEAATADPVERVFALLAGYRAGLEATGCTMGCPIGNLALEVADDHPEVRPLIERNFQGWIGRVERWLVEAGDRLPKTLDRRAAAGFVLAVMEGGLMRARAARSLAPYDETVGVLRTVFDGWRAEARAAGGKGGPNANEDKGRPGGGGASRIRGGARRRPR